MSNYNKIIGGGVDLSHLAARAKSRAAEQSAGFGGAEADSFAQHNSVLESAAAATQGAADTSQAVDIPAVVFEVTDANLDAAVQLSTVVPVVLLLTSAAIEAQQPQQETLTALVRQMGGKLVLGVIDAESNPQIVAALRPTALPTAVLIMATRPEMLYQGAQSAETLQQLLPQIVALAAQQGVDGSVSAPDLAAENLPAAPPEPQLNPAHQAAFDAAERGDYPTAIKEYEAVLVKTPRDSEASAALAQVKLLHRLSGKTMQDIREAAAADAENLEAQLLVADLDISGGHIEDGFLRLLELFAAAAGDKRPIIQQRLLELFEVVGINDPTVSAARRKLATLLY